jgi:hypothetical protein
MKINMNQLKNLTLGLVCLGMTACSTDKLDNSYDDLDKNSSANITFINALEDPASFYIKYKAINRSVFTDQYKAVDLLSQEISEPYVFQWNDALKNMEIGVLDTNSQLKTGNLDIEITENNNYWTIAWQEADIYKLSTFLKNEQNPAESFGVRILTSNANKIYRC